MGKSLPWPVDFNPKKMIVSPANNLMRRVSPIPVYPTMSWWNDFNGDPTGYANPEFVHQAIPGVDDFAFPALPNTSAYETIQKFNALNTDQRKVVTVFNFISFLTETDPLLNDLKTLASSPSAQEVTENNARVHQWHLRYKASLTTEGGEQGFGGRQDDFNFHSVSFALKSVAQLTPQLMSVLRASEMNATTSKRKRKRSKVAENTSDTLGGISTNKITTESSTTTGNKRKAASSSSSSSNSSDSQKTKQGKIDI